MIHIEQSGPDKERTCDACDEALHCRYVGTSPIVTSDGAVVKCMVIDKRDTSTSMLIPSTIVVNRCGKIDGYRVTVYRFRHGRFWHWLRGWFA